jgi:hypothetical protein
MIGLFWNIRGLVLIGRVPALTSRIRENHVDFVGVLEKKNMFTQGFLRSLTGSVPFNWFYQPAVGAASGILVGVNDDLYVATLSQILRFLVSIMVMDKKKTVFNWKLVVVYGSPCEDGKQEFIDELQCGGCLAGPHYHRR